MTYHGTKFGAVVVYYDNHFRQQYDTAAGWYWLPLDNHGGATIHVDATVGMTNRVNQGWPVGPFSTAEAALADAETDKPGKVAWAMPFNLALHQHLTGLGYRHQHFAAQTGCGVSTPAHDQYTSADEHCLCSDTGQIDRVVRYS
jgi:hypothetical protein